MRCLVRTADKWQPAHPDNLLRWLWQHDGAEAVVIDGATYYCGTESLAQQYRDKWAGEKKLHDKRKAAMFAELGEQLCAQMPRADFTASTAWCAVKGCFCSEKAACEVECNWSSGERG